VESGRGEDIITALADKTGIGPRSIAGIETVYIGGFSSRLLASSTSDTFNFIDVNLTASKASAVQDHMLTLFQFSRLASRRRVAKRPASAPAFGGGRHPLCPSTE